MQTYTIEQIKNYILKQDSLGDVLYNLNHDKIVEANQSDEVIEIEELIFLGDYEDELKPFKFIFQGYLCEFDPYDYKSCVDEHNSHCTWDYPYDKDFEGFVNRCGFIKTLK